MIPGLSSAITGRSPGAKSITHLGNIAWSAGATISGAIDLGAADVGKEIFLVASTHGSAAGRTLTAATTTVGGLVVTKATTENFRSSDGNHCAFVDAASLGGSQTVTATFSGNLDTGVLAVFAVYNRNNKGSNQTDTSFDSDASDNTCDCTATTFNVDGFGFGAHVNGGTTANLLEQDIYDPMTTVYNAAPVTERLHIGYRAFQTAAITPRDQWNMGANTTLLGTTWSFD